MIQRSVGALERITEGGDRDEQMPASLAPHDDALRARVLETRTGAVVR